MVKLADLELTGRPVTAAVDICIEYPYAYTAGHGGEITIFNISNPEAPVVAGRLTEGQSDVDPWHPIVKAGGGLYVCYYGASTGFYIRIYDVRNASSPVAVGTVPFEYDIIFSGMNVSGDTLFAALGSAYPLVAYDVSNIIPTLIGQYRAPDSNACTIAAPVLINNYVAAVRQSHPSTGLTAVTISRSTMREVASVPIAQDCHSYGLSNESVFYGTTIIIAYYDTLVAHRAVAIDFSDPLHPSRGGEVTFLPSCLNGNRIIGVARTGITIWDRQNNTVLANSSDGEGGYQAVLYGPNLYTVDGNRLRIYALP